MRRPGDRIVLEMRLNDQPMGSQIPAVADRQIDVQVEGQDSIAMIELVRNGRAIEGHFPEDDITGPLQLPGRGKCRLQYGWGPWAALSLGRTCPWDIVVRIEGGKFLRAVGCFQSVPFGENLRDKLHFVSETKIHLQSNTTRAQCFAEDPAKALVCELEGGAKAVLTVQLKKPVEQVVRAALEDLISENVVTFTDVVTSESYIMHRLVAKSEYSATIRWRDRRPAEEGPDWYYVRVTQHNGQKVWSSPVWVG